MGKNLYKMLLVLNTLGFGLTLAGCKQEVMTAKELQNKLDDIFESLDTFQGTDKDARIEVNAIFKNLKQEVKTSFENKKINRQDCSSFYNKVVAKEKVVIKNMIDSCIINSLLSQYVFVEYTDSRPDYKESITSYYNKSENNGLIKREQKGDNDKSIFALYDGHSVLASEDKDDLFIVIDDWKNMIFEKISECLGDDYELISYDEAKDTYTLSRDYFLPGNQSILYEDTTTVHMNEIYFEEYEQNYFDGEDAHCEKFTVTKISEQQYNSRSLSIIQSIQKNAENGKGYVTGQVINSIYTKEHEDLTR